jgi:hypothetical protein
MRSSISKRATLSPSLLLPKMAGGVESSWTSKDVYAGDTSSRATSSRSSKETTWLENTFTVPSVRSYVPLRSAVLSVLTSTTSYNIGLPHGRE